MMCNPFTKQKPLTTVVDERREKPTLKVFSSTIPQSYLDKTKKWDSELYIKQTVIDDTKIEEK